MKHCWQILVSALIFWSVVSGGVSRQPVFTSVDPTGTGQDASACISLRSPGLSQVTTTQRWQRWIMETGAVAMAGVKLADLEGNGNQEIILTTFGPDPNPYGAGQVFIIDAAGEPLPGWPLLLNSPLPGSAAVGDLDQDGQLDIVAGSWTALYAWNLAAELLPGFPIPQGGSTAPVLADLDNDADLEILFSGSNNSLSIYNADGSDFPGWPVFLDDLVGSPAVGDLDGDGTPEIVAGTYQPATSPDPYALYVWQSDGSIFPGWPFTTSGINKAAPVIADLDDDGEVEIINISYSISNEDPLYVLDPQGNLKPGWPVLVSYARLSSPAVGDLDGDGDLEIVVGGWPLSPPFVEKAFAFHHDGTAVTGWPVLLEHDGASGNINSGPLLADLDGDTTSLEVVIKVRDYIFALAADGNILPGFPLSLDDSNHSGTFSPTPALGDVDQDGLLELVAASMFSTVELHDLEVPFTPAHAAWPQLKQDRCNRGAFPHFLPEALEIQPARLPTDPVLYPAYPNPFNPTTTIKFTLPYPQDVQLTVYNILGQQVTILTQGQRSAGVHHFRFDGSGLPSGIYIYQLTAGDQELTKKMVLVK